MKYLIKVGDGVQKYIIFSSENQYTFIEKNKSIYMNSIKIMNDVTSCDFTKQVLDNGKTTITVNIKGDNFEKNATYTLVN